MSALEKILLVDDEQQVLDAYSRALRKKFQIETALSGAQGLQTLAEKGPFAVVVSDMRMPEMDGVKFLSRVKKRYPNSVRIMLTGNADQETAVSAINEGDIFRFLNKPCTTAEMADAIREAIQRHHCETIEQNLLMDATQQLDYLSEDQDSNPVVQALNATSGQMGQLAGQLANAAGMDKETADQCHMSGMMSCIGDLIKVTRFKSTGNNQPQSLDPCQLSAYMLGSWGLPKAVVEAIKNHRKPIEPETGVISVTDVLHTAWFLTQDESALPESLKKVTPFSYLSSFAGEEIAKKWIAVHSSFTQKEVANV